MTDRALYCETTGDETELTYSSDDDGPVAPNTADACDIVATDRAIYELGDPRRSSFPGRGTGGEIRRLVNPKFRPADD